jgi:tetratricopeptide (TPR) repeat protein
VALFIGLTGEEHSIGRLILMRKMIFLVFIFSYLVLMGGAQQTSALQYDIPDDSYIKGMTKDIQLNPEDWIAYCSRAERYMRMDLFDRAIADYTKVLSANPDYIFYSGNISEVIGKAYLKKAERVEDRKAAKEAGAKALDYFTQSLARNPDRVYGFIYRGRAYEAMAKRTDLITEVRALNEQAVNEYSKYIDMQKKEDGYWQRGQAYAELGEYNKAIADYTIWIKIGRYPSLGYIARGYIYSLIGEYQNALADYSMVSKKSGDMKEMYEKRSRLYLQLKMYDEAIEDFTPLIKSLNKPELVRGIKMPTALKEHCAELLHLRAGAYYEKAYYNKAFADCVRALELDPENEGARILKQKLCIVMISSNYKGDI